MLVIGVRIFAVDRGDADAEIVDQAGGDVVLGGERVGGDQEEVGAAGLDVRTRLAVSAVTCRHADIADR